MTSSRRPLFAGATAIAIWGATPLLTQIAVAGIDPANVGMLRTVIAALIVLPLALLLRLPRPRTRSDWGSMAMSSLAGFIAYTLLVTLGIQRTSTSHAALILAAGPLVTGVIGFTLSRRWPHPLWWLGAGIAMAGEVILIGNRAAAGNATLEGDLLVAASVLMVGTGYVGGARLSASIGTRAATAWSIGLAGALQLPVLLLRMDLAALPASLAQHAPSWLAVLFLAIVTSVLGIALWYWAIENGGVARIAPIQFFQPVVSLLLAVTLISEPVTWPALIALGTIIAAMLITRRANARQRPA